jgi:hypothetical protein
MFNTVAIDVFIGLVLVYLLYSLLTTIVGEMLAGWFGLRQRMMRMTIELMLNDGSYITFKKDELMEWLEHKIQSFFLKESGEFKHSLAGRFYRQPSIKYLSKASHGIRGFFEQTKPSYFSSGFFAETLINMLRNKGQGVTDIEKISFCLKFNTLDVQPETLKLLRDHLNASGKELPVLKEKFKEWFDETMDRTNGWYKRKMQFILFWLGFILAASFNVDSIQIARILMKDKDARGKMVDMGIHLSKDPERYQQILNNNGDTVLSNAILDSGFVQVTKDINDAGLILGLGWESIAEPEIKVRSISDSSGSIRMQFDSLRKYIRQLAKANNVHAYNLKIDSLVLDSLMKEWKYEVDSLQKPVLVHLMDSMKGEIAAEIRMIGRKNNLQWKAGESQRELVKIINALAKLDYFQVDSIYNTCKNYSKVTGKVYESKILKKIFCFWESSFWGFVITGLALSLGAPFWFDLLKKLVAIRSAGVKPEEKKEDIDNELPEPAKEYPLNLTVSNPEIRPGDFINEAIRKYSQDIRKIPGVKAVFRGMLNGQNCVQINVADSEVEKVVKNKFKSLVIEGAEIKTNILITGVPVTHQGAKGQISNMSGLNVHGTLGCILRNKNSNSLHFLSCWHVMKGDTEYDKEDSFTGIMDDSNKSHIGDRWSGGIQDSLDYAIAKYHFDSLERNNWLKRELTFNSIRYSTVTSQQINHQIPIRYFDILNKKRVEGRIYTDSASVEIRYLDKYREVKDLMLLTDPTFNLTISQPGNSGSVIFDNDGNALGMIIAGDNKYTYAIKFSNLFSVFKEMELDT